MTRLSDQKIGKMLHRSGVFAIAATKGMVRQKSCGNLGPSGAMMPLSHVFDVEDTQRAKLLDRIMPSLPHGLVEQLFLFSEPTQRNKK
ncbi:hypothetical protein [Yoonia sp. SS1-5]|uniref:Uncharacterized protein n=1 Tax=Yoonia rhodophyticola TaxID=3137370 RepID=A0AAN0MCW4_9RHOB